MTEKADHMPLRFAHEMYLSGLLPEAEASCRQLLQDEPGSPEALHLLGLIAHEAGDDEAALQLISLALQADPSMPEYYANRGVVLLALSRIDEAIICYRQAGDAFAALGRLDEAVASYKRILKILPNNAEGHYAIGGALIAQGKFDEAAARYKRAIAIRPDFVEAYNNAGCLHMSLGRFDEAAIYFNRLLGIAPATAEAHYNLGCIRIRQGRFVEAVSCFQQATAIRPDYADAHNNCGVACKELWKFDEAVACYRKALDIRPDYIAAYNNLGFALLALGKFPESVDCYLRVLEIKPDHAEAYSDLLGTLHYMASTTNSYAFDKALEFGRQCGKPRNGNRMAGRNHLKLGTKLKVGFVSGDLRNHPVGYFLESILRHVNPESLSMYAYANQSVFDTLSERIRPFFREWVTVIGMTDDELVSRIRDDGIDILVDLAGHTKNNRLTAFAQSPAPLQVTWLGYFATTGIDAMDYILADRFVVLPEEEHYFVEKIWRMPDSYLCFSEPDIPINTGDLPALSHGHITFGCFNILVKMNDAVVAVWARILQAVPDALLMLKAVQLAGQKACQDVIRRFAAYGIPAERLVLEGPCPRARVLADYNRVDIALDPFPFPGGTSTLEALWMGVPVLTLKGDRFLSHVGESIMMNTDMPEWIALDSEDYLHKAVTFAGDLQGLAQLRTGLREKLLRSPLFDAPRFAGNLEAALRGMWQQKYGADSTTGYQMSAP